MLAEWDEELRHGFVAPPPDYREAASRLAAEYEAYTRK
jgi:hypothetical protein